MQNKTPEKVPAEILIKQLLYRSLHRGCKETDFLIGKFVEQNLSKMSAEEMKILADFLQEDDLEIYDWILGKFSPSHKYQGLVGEIQKFHKL